MIVSNISKMNVLCHDCKIADTYFTRLKGLLGKSQIASDEGLLIKPCRSVHTIGMRFVIDVIFVATDGRVVELVHEMGPRRVSPHVKEAQMVLEVKAGQIKKSGVEIGDQLSFQ